MEKSLVNLISLHEENSNRLICVSIANRQRYRVLRLRKSQRSIFPSPQQTFVHWCELGQWIWRRTTVINSWFDGWLLVAGERKIRPVDQSGQSVVTQWIIYMSFLLFTILDGIKTLNKLVHRLGHSITWSVRYWWSKMGEEGEGDGGVSMHIQIGPPAPPDVSYPILPSPTYNMRNSVWWLIAHTKHCPGQYQICVVDIRLRLPQWTFVAIRFRFTVDCRRRCILNSVIGIVQPCPSGGSAFFLPHINNVRRCYFQLGICIIFCCRRRIAVIGTKTINRERVLERALVAVVV